MKLSPEEAKAAAEDMVRKTKAKREKEEREVERLREQERLRSGKELLVSSLLCLALFDPLADVITCSLEFCDFNYVLATSRMGIVTNFRTVNGADANHIFISLERLLQCLHQL